MDLARKMNSSGQGKGAREIRIARGCLTLIRIVLTKRQCVGGDDTAGGFDGLSRSSFTTAGAEEEEEVEGRRSRGGGLDFS